MKNIPTFKNYSILIRNSSLSQVHFAKLFSVTPQCIAYARNIGWKSLDEKPA
jgi:hypothetical protein